MKKILAILVLAVGVVFTANAQKGKGEKLTTDQRVEKKVGKLTSELGLSEAQVGQITPIVRERVLEREAVRAKRKAMKEAGEKPTEAQRTAFKAKKEERKAYYKGKMEKILTPEQMIKLEELKAKKKHKKGKKGKHCEGKSCEGKSCEGKSCEEKK